MARRPLTEGPDVDACEAARLGAASVAVVTLPAMPADRVVHSDHGAQFITAHTPRFAAVIEECRRAGVVEHWCNGFWEGTEGHARWRACYSRA